VENGVEELIFDCQKTVPTGKLPEEMIAHVYMCKNNQRSADLGEDHKEYPGDVATLLGLTANFSVLDSWPICVPIFAAQQIEQESALALYRQESGNYLLCVKEKPLLTLRYGLLYMEQAL